MASESRLPESQKGQQGIGAGPFLAKVISHLDPAFMGGLEVTILRDQANEQGNDTQTYTVRYMTPFYGSTAYEFMGSNKGNADAFNDTQKSYGMWFCPPDIGVTVMVMFIDGDPSQGYWIGCIPSRFANNMIPAIGATTVNDISPDDKAKYATSQPLPVAEINRQINDSATGGDIDKIKRPVHPIADRFLESGTLEDDVRGPATSTVRREVPSMVFGILTPGPLDKRDGAKKSYVGRKNSLSSSPVFVSRLGGTQLVFDDGDDQYQRKTPAGEGPVEYADILNGETGDPNIPYNEYARLRTRTGHQILLHNSEDLIYIGNAKGTSWIELTSNGKIDIYAEDSISIHTQQDFNFYANRDVNIEAGRNVNIKASGTAETDDNGSPSGRVQIESTFNFNLHIGKDGRITTLGKLDANATGDIKLTTKGTSHINSAGEHRETAGKIQMNSAAAAKALLVTPLEVIDNIATDGTLVWADTKYQSDNSVSSIMKRIPMHEPWALHENMVPTFVTPDQTDREL
jgi:hypothetical protein